MRSADQQLEDRIFEEARRLQETLIVRYMDLEEGSREAADEGAGVSAAATSARTRHPSSGPH
jgi:hypothetical protein